jgi:hypothetical protein
MVASARTRAVAIVAVLALAVTAFALSSIGLINAQSVFPSASPNPVEVGHATTISANYNPSGIGAGPGYGYGYGYGYTSYAWSSSYAGSPGTLFPGCPNPGSVAEFVCTPTAAGIYTIYVTVTDLGGSVSNQFTLTVLAGLRASLTAAPLTTQVGGTSTLTYAISGGSAPTWTLTENGSGNLTGASAGRYLFHPAGPGTFTFYLNATDSFGNVSTATATVTVEPTLLANLTAIPSETQVGSLAKLDVNWSGGVPPVTWTLTMNGSAANLTGAHGEQYPFDPVAAGTYTFYLNMSDSVGSISNVTTTVVVYSEFTPLLTATPGTTEVGASSTLSYAFAGGKAPIVWTLTKNGSAANLSGASGGTYLFTPSGAGNYTFYLNATDALGSASATATVIVRAALLASLSPSPGLTEAGISSTLTYALTGGVRPISWTLTENGSAANLTGATAGSYAFPASHAGTYTFYLNATDAMGRTSKVTATVVVRAALAVSLTSSPVSTSVGGTSTLTYTLVGGVAPVSWTLEKNGSAANLTGAVGGTFTFTPTHTGTYTFYLNATDAVGGSSRAVAAVVVTSAAPAHPAVLLGLPTTEAYAIFALIALLVILAIAYVVWRRSKGGQGPSEPKPGAPEGATDWSETSSTPGAPGGPDDSTYSEATDTSSAPDAPDPPSVPDGVDYSLDTPPPES